MALYRSDPGGRKADGCDALMENEDFLEFGRNYGEELANDILLAICEFDPSGNDRYSFASMNREIMDREGANCRITGHVMVKARCWYFDVESGNWNGTDVRHWERSSRVPLQPLPKPGPWIVATIEAVMVRLLIDDMNPLLTKKFENLMAPTMRRML